MPAIQIRRGLEANRTSITPAPGELIYITDTDKVYVGDGATAGGIEVGAGGGPSIGQENDNASSGNYTITTGKNMVSGGPIEITHTITVPAGSTWTIV